MVWPAAGIRVWPLAVPVWVVDWRCVTDIGSRKSKAAPPTNQLEPHAREADRHNREQQQPAVADSRTWWNWIRWRFEYRIRSIRFGVGCSSKEEASGRVELVGWNSLAIGCQVVRTCRIPYLLSPLSFTLFVASLMIVWIRFRFRCFTSFCFLHSDRNRIHCSHTHARQHKRVKQQTCSYKGLDQRETRRRPWCMYDCA